MLIKFLKTKNKNKKTQTNKIKKFHIDISKKTN